MVFTQVHLMNAEQYQVAADLHTQSVDLSCEPSCRLLLSTSTIAIYYYSVRKLILFTVPWRVND